MIPTQLKNMRFNRVRFKEKRAFENGWQNNPYSYEEIQRYLPKENYGVLCGKELRVLDDDTPNKELINLFIENFGETFRVRDHLYFKFNNGHDKKIILMNEKEHLGEIQGEGTYVVGAGSTHPSGEIYEIKNDLDIITINYDKFVEIFSKYINSNLENKETLKKIDFKEDDFIKSIKEQWSEGNRQDLAMSLAGYLRKEKRLGLESCLSIVENIAKDCYDPEVSQRLASVKATYNKDESEIKGYTGLKEKSIEILSSKIGDAFNKKDLAKRIIEVQPCYYDKSRNWWVWDSINFKWELVDETDILNIVDEKAAINTINSKEKNEMIEALKQVSRKMKPEEIDKSWIQFKDHIVDIKNNKVFKASPKYFVTNPIPWDIGNDDNTPNMDRIFEEWVGKDNVETLYEILAYCLIPDYPIHRIFCFIGSGLNGKSKFLELLRKFIGNTNCCSTELDTLLQSRFEVTRLHKKLVCQMGETNFNEMQKTSTLKKLSGGDLIGFEYKRKDPFEEINYAKIIIATNNLPATTDKTIGFYRRWMIIDFPNQFSEKCDILSNIPEEEYRALTVKCVKVLKKLLEKREFTNEGTIEDRTKKYEDHSNPLEKFLREFTYDDLDGLIWKNDFSKNLKDWCRQNKFREISDVEIGRKMKQLGINDAQRYADWGESGKRYRCWIGIKWRSEQDEQDKRVTPT